jgi:hypothetical protein
MNERRDWVRHPCRLRTYCQPGSGNLESVWWPACTLDLSATGMRLELHTRLKPGTILVAEVQNQPHNFARTIRIEVIHTARLPEGQWMLGCAFLGRLTTDELHTLLG